MEQVPFGPTSFPDNPEPRCPSLLLLDVSGSMSGQPIAELQEGLSVYKDELAADELAKKRVEVAIITFGGSVTVLQDFATVDSFVVPKLAATGETPMGQAVVTGLSLLDERKKQYRAGGILYFRPWVFLITDGAPTDDHTEVWNDVVRAVGEGEERRGFSFFAVGVEGANMEILKRLSPKRQPVKLKGLRFRDLFVWLSASQQSVSRSNPGDSVPLTNPIGPVGWGEVPG